MQARCNARHLLHRMIIYANGKYQSNVLNGALPFEFVVIESVLVLVGLTRDHPCQASCLNTNSSQQAQSHDLMSPDSSLSPRQQAKNVLQARQDRLTKVVKKNFNYIRLNTSDPFVPPKPKLFFNAILTSASRAVLAQ